MKLFSFILFPVKSFFVLSFLFLAACASNPHDASYKEEKNVANFENNRSFAEKPEEILRAARAVLDEWQQESDPPVNTKNLRSDDESVQTGWVYSTAKSKYVEFKMNGKPKRRPLKVRRKYGYSATPSLAGSQVVFLVEEEVQTIDFETGKEKGWSSEEPEKAIYDLMHKRLVEKLRLQ